MSNRTIGSSIDPLETPLSERLRSIWRDLRAPRARVHSLRAQRRRLGSWFALDRAARVLMRCAACGQIGVRPRQPRADVAFCEACLDRARAPDSLDQCELGVAG